MTDTAYPLLEQINLPCDLRRLEHSQLERLSHELRDFLIESVSQSGGHFAAGLGTVELTVALHYVYDTPRDRLVWDVGHQSYPHKILTGRRERIHTIRKHGGIAPFPKREESEYDTFGVGHAGTSIGAAQGMAEAVRRNGDDRKVVAIIGDGAMTAGMAFEALNHAGEQGTNMLVVLNDNNMSISPNVGALSNYFAKVLSSRLYTTVREESKRVLGRVPPVWELARRAEEHVKGLFVPGTLFEELGFNYIGPVDGHDVENLVSTLGNLSKLEGPRLLHVVTRKGKGYSPAEADPIKYHGIGSPFDPKQGIVPSKSPASPTFSDVFGDWICDMAARDRRLVGITPAMREGSGLVRFAKDFPEQYIDVAIAEQHAVTLAAGLACEGAKPVVAIYSSFLQRGYDSLVHDVALQNLPVLFAIDRAGLVGGDGATHAGCFDLSFMRCLPNMVIMSPADENECRQMLYTGFLLDQPAAVRYPRGKGMEVAIEQQMTALPLGRAEIRRQGQGIAILAFGVMLESALAVGEELNATVVNMRFVKPLDEKIVLDMASGHELLVSIDENAIPGGAAAAVGECLAAHRITIPHLMLGLPDTYIEHGSRAEVLKEAGLDQQSILAAICEFRAGTGESSQADTGTTNIRELRPSL